MLVVQALHSEGTVNAPVLRITAAEHDFRDNLSGLRFWNGRVDDLDLWPFCYHCFLHDVVARSGLIVVDANRIDR